MKQNGGIIGPVNTPTKSLASGIWGINEVYDAKINDTWPIDVLTPVMSYVGSNSYETAHTSHTFSSESYEGAGLIIVVVMGEASNNTGGVPSSVTIDGNTMTEVVAVNNAISSAAAAGIYSYVMTAGTSADIVVNWSTTMFRTGIAVWRITDYNSATAIDTQTDTSDTSSTSDSVTMTNLVDEAVIIAVHASSVNLTSVSYTNATERFDTIFSGGSHGSGADATSTGTSDITITVTYGTSVNRQALAAAAFH